MKVALLYPKWTGASTPDNIIKNVVTAIKSFGKVKEEVLIYE